MFVNFDVVGPDLRMLFLLKKKGSGAHTTIAISSVNCISGLYSYISDTNFICCSENIYCIDLYNKVGLPPLISFRP